MWGKVHRRREVRTVWGTGDRNLRQSKGVLGFVDDEPKKRILKRGQKSPSLGEG